MSRDRTPGPGARSGPGPGGSGIARAPEASAGARAVPVLMYHAVGDRPAASTYGLSVTPGAFAEQMGVLHERGFTPLTTRALADAWRTGGGLPVRPVLITFDDGYEGVHRHALPLLASYGFPATVFVSTAWLRGRYDEGRAPDAMLDWGQVRELASAGVEIGGHSHTHPQLDQLDGLRLGFEVRRCREIVAAELGTPPVSFAYPYGYSSRRVRDAVRAAGFTQSVAVGNDLARHRQGPHALRRMTVRRTTGIGEFAHLVEGRALARHFVTDRALTKGCAVVRRTRRATALAGSLLRGTRA